MSEYTDNCKRISDIIKNRPWLFKKTPNLDISEYIKHFERSCDDDFFIFPAMLPYKNEILEKYEKNVFNTMFLPVVNGNLSLHTIVQLNRSHHIFFMWGNSSDNKETVLYATLYTTNPADYRTFLIDNEKYINSEERTAGFSGHSR